MDDQHLRSLKLHLLGYMFFCGIVAVGFTAVVFAVLSVYTALDKAIGLVIACIVGVSFSALGALLATRYALAPIRAIQKIVAHVSSEPSRSAPLKFEDIAVGRELVEDLSKEINKIASNSSEYRKLTKRNPRS